MPTVTYQIAASAGDADEVNGTNDQGRNLTTNGVVSITRTVLSPGSHGSNDEWSVAIRFPAVAVPQGATITTATLTLVAQATYNASPNTIAYHVSCQAADNAAALTAASGSLNVTARPRTTADAGTWTLNSVTAGTSYGREVASIVQEVVNRAGWVSGNAMCFLIDTHSTCTLSEWQDFHAYDGSAANAPSLSITYTTAATSDPPPSPRIPMAILAR